MRHTGNTVIITDLDCPRIQFNSGYHDARFDVDAGRHAFSCRSADPRSMTCNTCTKDSHPLLPRLPPRAGKRRRRHQQHQSLVALAGDLDRRRPRRHRDPSASMRDRGIRRLPAPRTGRRHDPRRPPSDRRSTRTLKRKGQRAAIALTAAGRLEETHAANAGETWKRCYHRYRCARRYHDPTDRDADWTRRKSTPPPPSCGT